MLAMTTASSVQLDDQYNWRIRAVGVVTQRIEVSATWMLTLNPVLAIQEFGPTLPRVWYRRHLKNRLRWLTLAKP